MVKFNWMIRWIFLFTLLSLIYILSLIYYRKPEPISIKTSIDHKTTVDIPAHPLNLPLTTQLINVNIQAAAVLALSPQTSHIAEFHLLYDSWRFLQNFSPISQQVVVDLIVFCEQPSCPQLPSACLHLSYKTQANVVAQCYYEELFPYIVEQWRTYLAMTSIAFMLTKEYQRAIVNYQWILRIDQDAIISPGLLYALMEKHPKKLYNMQFGAIGHGIEFTHARLKTIAKKLGYNHSGIHTLCSTWLVTPKDSIQLANLTTIIGKHFVEKEFGPHLPGIEDLPAIGEWPKWWRPVISLYAGEIAINHYYSSSLGHQHESDALDHPSMSQSSIWDAWSIHCLHNADEFAKFKHRDRLKVFLDQEQRKRIEEIKNASYTQVLKKVVDEFRLIQNNNGTITGKIAVRDYVTALAWQKAYAATGAINLE